MLPRDEIARYLGYRGRPLEPAAEALAAECEEALFALCVPRRTARRMDAEALPFLAKSRDLRQHLQGCREVYLTALTLGGEADRLLRRFSAESMAKAAVGQACAAAWTDLLCDRHREELAADLPKDFCLLPPYSPGYGDFSLAWQETMLSLLGAKRLGLCVSGGGMLLPLKSVTAVLGISAVPAERSRCETCKKHDCPFRKGAAPCES